MNLLETTTESVSKRVATGLHKIGLAIRSRAWKEARQGRLAPLQAHTLSVLHLRQPQIATPTALAEELSVALPTVSEVLRVLERRGLIKKRKSETDGRTTMLSLTRKGRRRAEGVAGWTDFLAAAADELSDAERKALLRTLIKMIRTLQEQGMIPVARMCPTCRFFQPFVYGDPNAPHHCGYVNAAFGDRLLRIECAEHERANKEQRDKNWQIFMSRPS